MVSQYLKLKACLLVHHLLRFLGCLMVHHAVRLAKDVAEKAKISYRPKVVGDKGSCRIAHCYHYCYSCNITTILFLACHRSPTRHRSYLFNHRAILNKYFRYLVSSQGDGDDDGLLLTQAKPKPPLPFQQITLHVEVERERERGREVVLSIRLLLLPEKVEMYFTEFFNSATEKPKLIGIWLKLYNRISDNYSRHQFSGMNLYLVI